MMLLRVFVTALAVCVVGLISLWNMIPHPDSAIDWSEHPAVVFQSDDWGFCAWLPDSTALAELGPRIDTWIHEYPEFKGSTLESAADVDRLAEVLGSVRGGDGRPALMQPGYVLTSPDFDRIIGSDYTEYSDRILADDLPGWERPGLLEAVERARGAGVWAPEFHGVSHENTTALMRLLREGDPETRAAFELKVMVNDEPRDDHEDDPSRPLERRAADVQRGVKLFEQLFGRHPHSVSAPNYRWDESTEDLWASVGISVVQSWRLQTTSNAGISELERNWRRVSRPMGAYDPDKDLLYLYRNAFFEPSANLDTAPVAIADETMRAITHAWKHDRPAIICTHRMNYARLSPAESAHSLEALRALLQRIVAADPRVVFLTDVEVRQLYREGVSQAWIAPHEIRVRNYTREPQELRLSIPDGMSFAGVDGSAEVVVDGSSVVLTIEPGDYTVQLKPGLP